eukprot:CAMPEP_0115704218 /NCGR_PEP_ID=MMETSP0272-20121206/69540_1 /TAXON_ID=71861 /ORGANISM="Scrippsiella trochoidea, Strain CCMP3099" /LENGTH=84 /DNA_ID=CAMNT_0003145185 /DNA_START=161 /DNA_END=416 /DNA_ORIENTATION=+
MAARSEALENREAARTMFATTELREPGLVVAVEANACVRTPRAEDWGAVDLLQDPRHLEAEASAEEPAVHGLEVVLEDDVALVQ